MRLEKASLDPPARLDKLLAELGRGENGFTGTPVHNGEASLKDYLRTCCDGTDESQLKPGLVPQTVFWLLDSDSEAVGMVKVRHRLVASTRINGGHIGFFVSPAHRGKGYGRQALALALSELKKIGELRALVTVYPENTPSIRIVEANGGRLEDTILDPWTKHELNRYWIDLES